MRQEAGGRDLPAPPPSYAQQERLASEAVKEAKAEDGSASPKLGQARG